MKVFLDTNILIDFLSSRIGADYAAEILRQGEQKQIRLYASILTFANIAYILRKFPREELLDSLKALSNVITILKMDGNQMKKALADPFSDLEDTLQYQCAKAGKVDVILTNNLKHFSHYPLPSMTPSDFLQCQSNN